MKRNLLSVALVAILSAGLLGARLTTVQAAAITVDSNQDNQTAGDGFCTLREAISNANGDTDYTGGDCAAGVGADVITFDSPMTISLNAALGELPVYSQIRIDASSMWNTGDDRPGVAVDGVDQSFTCINIAGAASHVEVYGLFVHDCAFAIMIVRPNNTIGSTSLGQRNVLSNNGFGVWLEGADAHENVVQGNWIGLGIAGQGPAPNGIGVVITEGATLNDIGGQTEAAGNYISGNTGSGVLIDGPSTQFNRLGGNGIGTSPGGSTIVGNGQHGVLISQARHNQVGVLPMAPNVIARNGEDGVHITDGASDNEVQNNVITQNEGDGVGVDGSSTQGNLIEMNRIYENYGQGIRLSNGANGGIAAPTITNANPSGASGTACAACRVEVFSDGSDEGALYHGHVTADGGGNWTYSGALMGPNVTATNTDEVNSNTSEFSAPYTFASGGVGTCAEPVVMLCGDQRTGDTTGHASVHNGYSCSSWNETGPEVLYWFWISGQDTYTVTATLSNLSVDLDIFLLSSTGCDAGQCLDAGSYGDMSVTVPNMSVGSYYIAVDGFNGAFGSYTLSLTCTTSSSHRVFLPLVTRNH